VPLPDPEEKTEQRCVAVFQCEESCFVLENKQSNQTNQPKRKNFNWKPKLKN